MPEGVKNMLKYPHIMLIATTLLLFGVTQQAQAHPHAWIDLRTVVKFDDQGRITAVDVDWTFDPYYTLFSLEEIQEAGTALQPGLDAIARESLVYLREYDYFITVHANGAKQAIGDVTEFQTEIRGERLWMRFEAPLATPIDPKAMSVSVSSYDPTFYIEVLYAEEGPLMTFEDANNGAPVKTCSAEIIQPNPTMEERMFAASLGPDEDGGTSLGEIFAEKAVLTCK